MTYILKKKKTLGLRKKERETPIRTLSLFSLKKYHTIEFIIIVIIIIIIIVGTKRTSSPSPLRIMDGLVQL